MIVPDLLRQSAVRAPDDLALVVPGREPLTYGALDAAVDDLATSLATAGIRAGDRVVAPLGATAEGVALLHASARVGAVFVPVDPRAPAPEILRALSLSGARWIAVGRDGGGEVVSLRDGVGRVVVPPIEDGGELQARSRLRGAGAEPPTTDLAQPRVVVFTSGTTGIPRPVVLTGANLLASARANAERLGHDRGDRWLSALPLHHVGGLSVAIRSAVFGACAEIHPRFEARAFADAIASGRVTLASLVPTTLARVLDAMEGRRAPSALRAVLLGGAAAPAGLLARALAAGFPVAPTYGLTEAASQVATARPGDPCIPAGRVGTPVGASRVRIARRDGSDASPGEEGEIEVAGPTVSPGWLAEDGSIRAFDREGWLRTGDLGSVDGSGNLLVLGRRDDVIVTGGENVSPDEVEAVLLDHPAIAEAGVAGVPDPEWGQLVAAWIVPRGTPPSLEDVRDACRARLSPPKLPRRLYVVESLPRTAIGKLRRSRLREKVVSRPG